MPRSSSSQSDFIGQPRQLLAPEDIVVWNWPLRDEGLRSWAILVSAIALTALVWAIWGNPAFALFAYAMLALINVSKWGMSLRAE